MIRIRQLEFAYGEGGFRLSLPEFDVARGERIALVGPSGTGKTTLLHLIAGIRRPDSGTVEVGETRVDSLGERERRAFRLRRVGLVFQEFELLDYLDALGNILLPYRLASGLDLTPEVRKRAHRLAESLGVGGLLRRSPSKLSTGEKQRVAVCRALLPEPELLLADEPTGNLDPAAKERALDLLLRGAKERGTTLVVVTHDHALLGRFDRVASLPGGGA